MHYFTLSLDMKEAVIYGTSSIKNFTEVQSNLVDLVAKTGHKSRLSPYFLLVLSSITTTYS